MDKLKRLELFKDFIQEAVDRGASSVEEIHQYIADLPFEAIQKAGLLKADTLGLRALSRRSIGLVYGAVRRINHSIGQLISDQIENIEETQEVSKLLSEHSQRLAAGKRSAVDPPSEPVVTLVPTAKKQARAVAKKPRPATKRPVKKTATTKQSKVSKASTNKHPAPKS
jgi:hypothetical protein